MKWQYRTIVFEFAKDGLLGDRYINDEEMEATLNEQGEKGWNLVNVVMIQEGILAVLKRPENVTDDDFFETPASGPVESRPVQQPECLEEPVTAEQIRQQEMEHIRQLELQRKQAMDDQDNDHFGTIRIS